MANQIDFAGINNRLLPNAKGLLQEWLPGGRFEGNEYLAFNPTRDDSSLGSFSINWKYGSWMDGATGDKGGDLISLYAYINKMKQGEAAKALGGGSYKTQGSRPKPPPKKDNVPTLCLPVPKDAPDPPPRPHGKAPSMIHTYTDAAGQIMCHIYRFEAGNGQEKKSFLPYTCWRDKSGRLFWDNKHIPENRPLYGLEELAKYSDYPVLVVSGEKCVDAARKKLRGYVVVTWMNGDQSTGKTNFTPLKGRRLIWWPDNDITSKNAMRKMADIYGGKILNIGADKPKGWDCADAVAEGVDLESIIGIEENKTTDTANKYPSLDIAMPQGLFEHTIQGPKDKIKIQGTIKNVETLMEYYGIKVWYDEVKDTIYNTIAGNELDNIDIFNTEVESACVLNEFPKFNVRNYVRRIAYKNKVNPVVEWVDSCPWDRTILYIKQICDIIHCDDSLIQPKLKETFIKKWILSAYAMVSRKNADDRRTRGVLVLQGGQGIGKTEFLKSLCGEKWGGNSGWFLAGHQLDPSNRDSVLTAQKSWIVELAELESAFRSPKALPALKAYLTNPTNTVRRLYAVDAEDFHSRTVYAGTVNQKDFLIDDTGNDRFWCLPIISIDKEALKKINMQQVWAEAKWWVEESIKNGNDYIWWLSPEERDQLNINNREYNVCSTVRDYITQKLDWNAPEDKWSDKTCTIILKEVCGMPNVTNADARSAAYVMREMLGMDKAPKLGSHGARVYPCPPAKIEINGAELQQQPFTHWANNR